MTNTLREQSVCMIRLPSYNNVHNIVSTFKFVTPVLVLAGR